MGDIPKVLVMVGFMNLLVPLGRTAHRTLLRDDMSCSCCHVCGIGLNQLKSASKLRQVLKVNVGVDNPILRTSCDLQPWINSDFIPMSWL